MGVACALAGSSAFQISVPVSRSNARRYGSLAAAVKTSPPAVIIGPPRLTDPGGRPGASEPSGAFQRIFPEFRSSATIAPQGGAVQGIWRGLHSGSRYTA